MENKINTIKNNNIDFDSLPFEEKVIYFQDNYKRL